MNIAIWIIAVCEVVRLVQNAAQLVMLRNEKEKQDTSMDKFVESFKRTDMEFRNALDKCMQDQGDDLR